MEFGVDKSGGDISVDEHQLTERMNRLAAELAGLEANDPRRAEIINEIARLSRVSASIKQPIKDG
jgi:hypothetical protein